MDTIQNNNVVDIEYTLTNSDGAVIDSSKGREPLSYIQGKANIIPGLESEIEGKKLGDKFNVTIDPENAYGDRDDNLTQSVPKSNFGEDVWKVKVGDQLEVRNQNGEPMVVTVAEVKEEEIVLDANHPLAGMALTFDVEIVGIREATAEELELGYISEEKAECDPQGGCC